MPASRIVEPLNVIEHVGACCVPRPVDLPRRPLGLERREEAFHCLIIPDVAGARQAAHDAVLDHQALALLARILRAAIGMMQQLAGASPPPQRHHQRIADQVCRHRGLHRPADNPA